MIERSPVTTTVTTALRWLAEMDTRLFVGLNGRHRSAGIDRAAQFISFTADGYLYALLALLLLLLSPAQGTTYAIALLLAFLIELPVYWILKNSFRRRRPFRVVTALRPLLKPADEFSFPSGHTTAAFMVAGITTVFFPAFGPFTFTWAVLVGLSRIMLKVHFISDVIAGALLGACIAFLTLGVLAGYQAV
jgi:undecaprenyl-diphosphatase